MDFFKILVNMSFLKEVVNFSFFVNLVNIALFFSPGQLQFMCIRNIEMYADRIHHG